MAVIPKKAMCFTYVLIVIENMAYVLMVLRGLAS